MPGTPPTPAAPMLRRINGFVLVRDDQERILMTRWAGGRRKAWTLPGGIITPGHDPRDAAIGHLMNETGLTADVDEHPFAIASRVLPAGKRPQPIGAPHTAFVEDLQIFNFFYFGYHPTGTPRPAEPETLIDLAQWFDIDKIPEPRIRYVNIALARAGLAHGE